MKSICEIPYPEDGVRFDPDSIILQDIRKQNSYQDQRAKIIAFIGKARIVLQIDIGIGDSVYPTQISRKISSYPIETVISEKLEAIITLGLLTSRMKDFYDLYAITSSEELDYLSHKTAIEQTFSRRGTAIPAEMPEVLSRKVYEDATKKLQWNAFVGKLRNKHTDLQFSAVIIRIQDFTRVFWTNNNDKPNTWKPGKGWT